MIKVYLLKTDAYNMVVISDGEIAKLYDCAPDGMFGGVVDIYSPAAPVGLEYYFLNAFYSDNLLTDISDYCGSDELPFFDIADSVGLYLVLEFDENEYFWSYVSTSGYTVFLGESERYDEK